MRNKLFLLLGVVTMTATSLFAQKQAPMMRADAMRDTVPSNYGNWLNLTDGYTEGTSYDHLKMEVEIDGNLIHLCWLEKGEVEGMRNIWYRRSTDLGKTWEDAKIVLKVRESYSSVENGTTKLMSANNGKVHIAATHEMPNTYDENYHRTDGSTNIHYVRSEDGGKTFGDVQVLGKYTNETRRYSKSLIQSDGNTVVIATMRMDYGDEHHLKFLYSNDGGNTFSMLTHSINTGRTTERSLLDLQVSGEKFAVMYWTGSWYSGLNYGNMMILCCDGYGDMSLHNIAPVCTKESGSEEHYANPNVMTGFNGNSLDYHPQMLLDGETIQVMYRGNPGLEVLDTTGWDYEYTLYQRSEDFGKTWSDVSVLPDADGGAGTIAAKGQNVYIVTTHKGLHTIYYSHDKGKTFEAVTQTIFPDERYNPSRDFHITIDPTDETGQHAYFTGNRYFYAETHDGFRTLSRNFCIGTETWYPTNYSNNYSMLVCVDDEGQEHWFMQYAHPTVVTSGGYSYGIEEGSRDIVYRRVETEPDPAEEMALNIEDTYLPQHRVVVPMSPSLQQKQAITVECWTKFDTSGSFPIASCTDTPSQEASEYNGGWHLYKRKYYYDDEQYYLEGAICTDAEENNKVRIHFTYPGINITMFPGEWHHVALTYDDNVAENNACLYIDGKLAEAVTIHGNLRMGHNPIALGRVTSTTTEHSEGLLDNFAIWNRALSADEVLAHASDPKAFDGSDDDCRLFLTFDGTLQDQSQYGNDGVAIADAILTPHDGIVSAISGIFAPAYDVNPASDYIYSIDGRLMNGIENLPKGIYIRNGEKIIIK